jgi:peptidoglycan/xylan/chitin deacetylase (PgdA/CDA1 family)
VEIGSHTVTHPMLAKQPASEQRFEIEQSKSMLEQLLKKPLRCFSYPNGIAPESAKSMVKEMGYAVACASYNDAAWRGSDLFYLPRFWIPDWNGKTFSRWLQRWIRG